MSDDSEEIPRIDGQSIDVLEENLIKALYNKGIAGNAAAAKQTALAIAELRVARASREHRRKMRELPARPLEFCRYLGEIGVSELTAPEWIGHRLSAAEKLALREGRRARELEMRAIALEGARAGTIKPLDWML